MSHEEILRKEMERMTEEYNRLKRENEELRERLEEAIKIDAKNVISLLERVGELEEVVGYLVNGSFTVGNSGVLVNEDAFFALKRFINRRR